jgi:ribosomal protein L37AE/L43A
MKLAKAAIAVQEPAETLAELAERINTNHQTAVEASRLAVQKGVEAIKAAMVAGQYLLAAKAKIGHGGWLKWLAENCPSISEDTSERYRRLAEYGMTLIKEPNSAGLRNFLESGSLQKAYIAAGIVKNAKAAHGSGDAISKRGTATGSSRPKPSEFVKVKGLAVQLWNLLTSTTDPGRMANEIQPVIQWHQDFIAKKTKREAALNDGFDASGSQASPEPEQDPDARFECNSCGETFEDETEGVALYECGECGSTFTRETSANDNHQCPDCNKFGSKVSDVGCPSCNEGELEQIGTEDEVNEAP